MPICCNFLVEHLLKEQHPNTDRTHMVLARSQPKVPMVRSRTGANLGSSKALKAHKKTNSLVVDFRKGRMGRYYRRGQRPMAIAHYY